MEIVFHLSKLYSIIHLGTIHFYSRRHIGSYLKIEMSKLSKPNAKGETGYEEKFKVC